ncbi:lytic transglycosylase domain-containing protein [Sinirhodobacter hankyongi]|uniref:Lytic transglycosylase domain-containing protein n=2 Tax=Paenirhodobacter hankyongi TaxID=2294033 RepID=A0A421BNS6_9RHOB|nr:lytic transglycosylase domain-containing protein [Sinirhodobacter hankyongi]RLL64566.1 lytic transglycosylase domain-containing protein [Sinirhodobacter hankyongi]
MMIRRSLLLTLPLVIALAACGADPRASSKGMSPDQLPLQPGESTEMRGLINKYADHYEVPRTLVHRIVQRESGYNPTARNGSYMGLMQIDPRTASTMGFSGSSRELLDAETNLKYAVKYLRGAWLCADGNENEAVGWYARGYYYEAKRRGILKDAGLRG